MPLKTGKDQTKTQSAYESETINRLKKTVENLDKENIELQEKLKENNGEIENLKAIAGITGQGDNVSNQTNTNGGESRSAPPASTNDITGEGNIRDQSKEIERLTDENKALKEELEKLAEKERQNRQLTKAINDLKTENENLKKANNPAGSRDLKAQVKHLKEENENLMEEKIKAVKEVDNLKNRLSQIAGSKQIDNNPGIADHSDPNRPLELGGMFAELFDNQWTDAVEEMMYKMDEMQAIQKLLKIVNDAYNFCVQKSDEYCDQIEAIITKVFNTNPSSLQKKLTKDYRKSMAVFLVSDLEEEFCKSYKYEEETVKSYQKQCIRVCWFMAVQDPKVFIDVEDVSGKKFVDDKYKYYTKKGKVIDYLVWPVSYLHKDGPLLWKGVAQGK